MAFWNRAPRQGRTRAVLRASAYKKNLTNDKAQNATKVRREGWQEESLENFDELAIVKAPVWWSGNAMSKLKLFAGVRPIDDPEGSPIPVSDPGSGVPTNLATYAQAEIERLKSPFGGRAEILRMMQMNLELTGLAWLIGIGATSQFVDDGGIQVEIVTPESWDVKSVREVEEKGSGTTAKTIIHTRPGDNGYELSPDRDEAIAVFQRNPGWSSLADCHMRGLLTDCASLVLLQNEVQAESKSRQSNGILLLPNELGQGPIVDSESEDGDEAATDPLMDALADSLIEPIEDPSSAASVVPMLLRGPADALKEVRLVRLSRETTAVLEQRIEARKVGIAEGMNLPPEVVRGHMGTTFANAAQIDQDTYDDYLSPRVGLICDGLTVAFLQPHLLDAGFPPDLVERIIIAPDPSDMIKTADPAEFVDEGVTLDTISDEAWRRYRGFSEDDAPPPEDRLIRAILKQRSWDAGLVDAVVKDLDPTLKIPAPPGETVPGAPQAAPAPPIAASALVDGLRIVLAAAEAHKDARLAARATGALQRRSPGHVLAAIDRDLRTKTLTAANHAMNRALERAGNRLKARNNLKASLKTINPVYAAQQLGPELVASAGFSDDELIGGDAFDGTVAQFDAWTAYAQNEALAIAAGVVTLSGAQREQIRQQQIAARKEAGEWLRDALTALAAARLYAPDDLAERGEVDPSGKVPAGLVRFAMAIAGGAQGLEQKAGSYVAEVNGQPPGGIGNGQTLQSILSDGGAKIQANVWDYGPSQRLHPFEPHEDLDGLVFESFQSDDLATDGAADWVGLNGASYFPGDHDGCACEYVIVWVTPDELTGDTGANLAE